MKRLFFGIAACLVASIGGEPAFAAISPNDLVVKAGSARLLLAGRDATLPMLDLTSRQRVVDSLQLDDPNMTRLWSIVLNGAVQTRRETGDEGYTLWFNPLFDAGVITHWVRTDGQWQVQAVEPITGMALRGEEGAIKPRNLNWLKARGNMGAALGSAAQSTFQAADQRDWKTFFGAHGNTAAALMRAYEGQVGLMRMFDSPGYGQALDLVDRLLVTGDPVANKLPTALRADLARFGEPARASLKPVAAYRRHDGWSLALQSAEAPQVVWFVHFADPVDGKPARPKAFVSVGQGPANVPAVQKESTQ